MIHIDPVRALVSGLAGLLVFSVLSFVAFVCSMFVFEWDEDMPTGNVWFWFYGVVCVVISIALGVFISRLSYRGLSKIGAKRNVDG
jgi:hypothetical protein